MEDCSHPAVKREVERREPEEEEEEVMDVEVKRFMPSSQGIFFGIAAVVNWGKLLWDPSWGHTHHYLL